MEVSREELAMRLGEMSDEELQRHVASRDLTPMAIEVAGSLLRSRGLSVPVLSAGADDTGAVSAFDGPVGHGADLVTVAEARNSIEAHAIKRFLESRDLFAAVIGEFQTAGPLDFQYGSLPRIQVRSDQAAQAREVLAAMRRGELERPEVFDAEFVSEPSHSDSESAGGSTSLADGEFSRFDSAGPSASSLRPVPRAAAPSMSRASSATSTAVNPVAPPGKSVLSRLLVLVIGVVVTVWLWATLTH